MQVELPLYWSSAVSSYPNLGPTGTVTVDPLGIPVGSAQALGALIDSSDVTYFDLTGSAAAPIAAGGSYSPLLASRIPNNSIIGAVTLRARLRGVSCDPASVYVYQGAGELAFMANAPTSVPTTSDFVTYEIPVPFKPISNPPTAWSTFTPVMFDNLGGWGVVVATDCEDSGGSQRVFCSELLLLVDVTAPTPVVTTVTAAAGAGAATLYGTINPNQGPTTNSGNTNLISTLMPVSWQFYFGTSPDNLTPVGSPQGQLFCGPPDLDNVFFQATSKTYRVSAPVNRLSPSTTYYYALAGIVDGVTTMSTVASFTTPAMDSSIGAF
jgi:hypothetical protein